MDKFKILIVDDELRMRKLVRDFLIKNGYDVIEAEDGVEALEIFDKEEKIDLIILDVMMPRMNGWDTCIKIREKSNIPIMMLTAKAEEYDELKGFEIGVNEYMTKPFSPKILVARVENIFKRFEKDSSNILEEVGIEINFDSHEVKVDGEPIELSIKEFELLEYFLRNKNIALSREAILTDVWKYDYFGDARTIDTHVKKLRQKIGEKGDYIKTIWGLGYKFEVE